MRTRLVIPAAILVTAAYVKGRRDAIAERPATRSRRPIPIPVAMPGDAILRAEAEAADARFLAEAEESLVLAEEQVAATLAPERPPLMDEVRAILDPDLLREWSAPRAFDPPPRWRPHENAVPTVVVAESVTDSAPEAAPAVTVEIEIEIDESGRFSLGGWATQAGHMAVHGVTFRVRRDVAVDAGAIRLIIDADENVAPDGLVVLGDAGFAPDREGFTLLLAAAGPGRFAATGRYEVAAA